MSVNFDELVYDTEKVMKVVAGFLNIEFEPVMKIATRDGIELICNGKKYTGLIHDDPEKLLSKKEKRILAGRKWFFRLHGQNCFPFSRGALQTRVKNVLRNIE